MLLIATPNVAVHSRKPDLREVASVKNIPHLNQSTYLQQPRSIIVWTRLEGDADKFVSLLMICKPMADLLNTIRQTIQYIVYVYGFQCLRTDEKSTYERSCRPRMSCMFFKPYHVNSWIEPMQVTFKLDNLAKGSWPEHTNGLPYAKKPAYMISRPRIT